MAVMNIKNGNVVDAIVNAIVGGFRDDLILEELASALENEDITKDQFKSACEGLKLYVKRFTDSIKSVTDAMRQFEFNEKTSIIKNRPMNLAQQVMQDVGGFDQAVKEYYQEESHGSEEHEADINKPKHTDQSKPQLKNQENVIKKTKELPEHKTQLPPQRNK